MARVLTDEGPDGLRKIQLQPLVPVKPTLAGGTTDEIEQFPVWVERKYDGIRLMLHKSTDNGGAVLCGAYTRNRGDWLELIPGMDRTTRKVGRRYLDNFFDIIESPADRQQDIIGACQPWPPSPVDHTTPPDPA